jgi:glycosyltransferase involved in cell wall biosynthesis
LVPSKNPNALTNAITGLLEDDTLRAELGRRSCQLAKAYTWENVAERIERVYIEAVEST